MSSLTVFYVDAKICMHIIPMLQSQEATGVLLTFGAGNAIGVIIGGVLGHFTYRHDVRGPPLVMGISLILGCLPFYFLINKIDENASVSERYMLPLRLQLVHVNDTLHA